MKSTTEPKKLVALKGETKRCKVCAAEVRFTRLAARNWETIDTCSAACRRTAVSQRRKNVAAAAYDPSSISA